MTPDPMFYSHLPEREDMGIEPYQPMRGVIFGCALGAAFWVVLAVIVHFARSK